MRKTNYVFIAIAAIGLIISNADARSKRVNQIPNGSVNGCANCHVDPEGGGDRTSFGEVVRLNYLDLNGDVIWGQAPALNDADGDGVTNGEELQDPTGSWTIGASSPGTPALVTNPGDPNSATNVERIVGTTPQSFKLYQNYPNPFNPLTNISFDIAQPGYAELRIFNSLGQIVKTLTKDIYDPGTYHVQWDGLDKFGHALSSGIYLYRLDAGNFSQTRRMMYLR